MTAFARRLATLVAARLRGGVARAIGRPPLAVAWVLPLTAAIILLGLLSFYLIAGRGPLGRALTAKADDPVVMFKNPSVANLWLCKDSVSCTEEGQGQITINEEVSGIPGDVHVGSFAFLVYFSDEVVDVAVSEGPFLGSTGRETECNLSREDNWLLFGCTSSGSQPGPTGSGILAYLTVTPSISFRPTLGNGVFVHLVDSGSMAGLADDMGNRIHLDEVTNSTILLRALEGDVNYDCRVNVIDEQSLSGRYGLGFGSLWYQALYDLEPSLPDDDIDIKDLQFVFGRDGSTCEIPLPPQPEPTLTPTATPVTGTPTATPTATITPGGPTATPTSTFTPGTPTITTTPGGATATPTPSTVTPTRTPAVSHKTRTPTATPGATTTATPIATPTAVSSVVPGERTPTSVSTTLPAGRTPGPAEELPGAGTGGGTGGAAAAGWMLATMAALAVLGWAAVIGTLRLGGGGLARSIAKKVRSRTRL